MDTKVTFSRSFALLITLILSLMISACASVAPPIADGMVIEIQVGAVTRGIGAIANKTALASEVMVSPGQQFFIFKWAIPEIGQAWTVFDGRTATPVSKFLTECAGQGSLCNVKTYKALKEAMLNNDWKVLSPTAAAVAARTIYSALLLLTTREFVVPVYIAPVVTKDGDFDWARYFEEQIEGSICAPLVSPDGVWFDPCAIGPQT